MTANRAVRMEFRLWGVRGSIPTPRADSVRYGGNTTCLQVMLPGTSETLIIDAGTGIREFGAARGLSAGPIHLLLSHFHWDHIQGLPFFPPLFEKSTDIYIYADYPPAETEQLLRGQMTFPYFPVLYDCLASQRQYRQFLPEPLQIGPAAVTTFPLNHPQGARGFRVELGGAAIVHVCDHEHGSAKIDAGIVEAAKGADLLIYDGQFTSEEYETRKGWGHSTWLEGVKIAERAGVKQLLITHHDPDHNDTFLDEMIATARRVFPAIDAARESVTVTL